MDNWYSQKEFYFFVIISLIIISLITLQLFSGENEITEIHTGSQTPSFSGGEYKISVVINEVMASNRTTIADEENDYNDWIELYNHGDYYQDLSGLFLSDSKNNLYKWEIPDGLVIEAGEYIIIWASGKDRTNLDSELHTNFRISRYGEELFLTHYATNTIVDHTPKIRNIPDMSYGRYPDASNEWVLFEIGHSTPGGSNSEVSKGNIILQPPAFSHTTGLYERPFILEIFAFEDNAAVYFTLDGSLPDPNDLNGSTKKYEEPIVVEATRENVLSGIRTSPYWNPPLKSFPKSFIIRAITVKEGFLNSEVLTQTYLFLDPNDGDISIPIICIATNHKNLFDYELGLYVPGITYDENYDSSLEGWQIQGNYSRRGRETEVPIHFSLIEPENEEVVSMDAGLRIHGGATRTFAQKSFRIYARRDYGLHNRIRHEVFPGLKGEGTNEPVRDFKRLILRNSGNDFTSTMFRDAMMQRLVKDFAFDTQAYRPAIIYINGEYWGIKNIRERYDRFYLQSHYGANPDNVVILEGGGSVTEGNPEGNEHYYNMLEYIRRNDLSESKHFDHVETMMDMENYIDYIVAQVYFDNTDWPHNNIDFWRYETDSYDPDAPYGLDGRWRWLLYDTDFGFGIYTGDNAFAANTLLHATSMDWASELLNGLLENRKFQERFTSRFADVLNSAFEPGNVLSTIDEMQANIEPYMGNHLLRWNLHGGNVGSWNGIVNGMRRFASLRPDAVRNHITEFFGYDSGIGQLTVLTSDEQLLPLQINSLSVDRFPWSGKYFIDVPVSIKAVNHPEKKFIGWNIENGNILDGGISDPKILLEIGENTVVKAIFE